MLISEMYAFYFIKYMYRRNHLKEKSDERLQKKLTKDNKCTVLSDLYQGKPKEVCLIYVLMFFDLN